MKYCLILACVLALVGCKTRHYVIASTGTILGVDV
jgi:hypothetical protein